jgi:hypothetical protein
MAQEKVTTKYLIFLERTRRWLKSQRRKRKLRSKMRRSCRRSRKRRTMRTSTSMTGMGSAGKGRGTPAAVTKTTMMTSKMGVL